MWTAVALALAIAAMLPAAAAADVAAQIVNRCGHGESLAGFTVKQYQLALERMPTEVREYSNCAELIQQAELAAASHKGGTVGGPGTGSTGSGTGSGTGPGGVGGAAVEPTPAQQRTLEQTRKAGAPAVHLSGGDAVTPGVVHPSLASATSNLPPSALVVVGIVLAGLLLLAGREAKEHITRSGSVQDG
jgi:hypothetical protein